MAQSLQPVALQPAGPMRVAGPSAVVVGSGFRPHVDRCRIWEGRAATTTAPLREAVTMLVSGSARAIFKAHIGPLGRGFSGVFAR